MKVVLFALFCFFQEGMETIFRSDKSEVGMKVKHGQAYTDPDFSIPKYHMYLASKTLFCLKPNNVIEKRTENVAQIKAEGTTITCPLSSLLLHRTPSKKKKIRKEFFYKKIPNGLPSISL